MGRDVQILTAARDLFLREGLDALSMRKIAAAVGISAPAIYKHYADKDEILRHVVDMGRERFAEFLVRGLQGATPRERLVLTGVSYLEFALQAPEDFKVMFMAWDRLRPGVHGPHRKGEHAPMFAFLLDRVRECLPAGSDASPEAVLELALLFWAQCHGLASLYLSAGGSGLMPLQEFRERAPRLMRRVVEAVLGEEPRAPASRRR